MSGSPLNGRRSRPRPQYLEYSSTSVHYWTQQRPGVLDASGQKYSPYRLPTDTQKPARQRQSYPAAHQQNNNNVMWNKQKIDEQTTTFSTAKNEPPRRDWRREEVEYRLEKEVKIVHSTRSLPRAVRPCRHQHSVPQESELRPQEAVHIIPVETTNKQAGTSPLVLDIRQRRATSSSSAHSPQHLIKIDSPARLHDRVSSTHSMVPGRPPTTYEQRYESLEQLNEWMKEQPIEMYELERHDRLCQMFAGRGVLLQFGGVFWVG